MKAAVQYYSNGIVYFSIEESSFSCMYCIYLNRVTFRHSSEVYTLVSAHVCSEKLVCKLVEVISSYSVLGECVLSMSVNYVPVRTNCTL